MKGKLLITVLMLSGMICALMWGIFIGGSESGRFENGRVLITIFGTATFALVGAALWKLWRLGRGAAEDR